MSQRGFVSLPIVIAVVLGLGLAASMYLNYAQHERAVADQKLLQGQITDLRYAARTSPSPSVSMLPEASPTPSSSSSSANTPTVAGTASVSIGQFNVKVTATDPVLDLTYAPSQSGGLTVAGFTTESLLAKYPSCKPGVALGMLVRRPKGSRAQYQDKLIKTIGAYDYYYSASSSSCASDTAGRNALAAARAALATTVLPTLSN